MQMVKEGVLRGSFAGFGGTGTVFEFSDGGRWKQVCATLHAYRAFMPNARITLRESKFYIEVDGIGLKVEVEPGSESNGHLTAGRTN